jgi:demethylmenaquinone methyltransferase/2-methoxy-6-polyprenyl-1,4-benzoquinol methylase
VDARWRRRAVDALAPAAGARVLDLCTGTADLLIEALGRTPAGQGVGLDLSPAMLSRGGEKLRRRGLAGRSALLCGDGERLPVASASFDGALVSFGIRNVGRPEVALRELRRVLRPGGRLVVLEFAMPRGVVGAAYRLYFRRVLPFVGGLVSGDPGAYAYLPASVARFPTPESFAELMRQAGFSAVVFVPLTAGIAYVYRGEAA